VFIESNHSQWQQSFTSDSLITLRGAYFTKTANFPDIQITFMPNFLSISIKIMSNSTRHLCAVREQANDEPSKVEYAAPSLQYSTHTDHI
jgi:hypothetical protein